MKRLWRKRHPLTMVDLTQYQRDHVAWALQRLRFQGRSPEVSYLGRAGSSDVVLEVICADEQEVRSYRFPPCALDPVGHATRRKAPMPWLSP